MPLTSIGDPSKLMQPKPPPQCSSRAIAKTLDADGTAAAAVAVTEKDYLSLRAAKLMARVGGVRLAHSAVHALRRKKKCETDTDRLRFLVLAGGLVFGPPRRDAAECIHVYPAKPGHPCATAENGAETKEFSSPLSSG